MAYQVKIVAKDDLKTAITTSDVDATGKYEAAITGLTAGTEVKAGDYKVIIVDKDGIEPDSDPIDIPAFTVLPKPQAPKASNVVATATADGATITGNVTK